MNNQFTSILNEPEDKLADIKMELTSTITAISKLPFNGPYEQSIKNAIVKLTEARGILYHIEDDIRVKKQEDHKNFLIS